MRPLWHLRDRSVVLPAVEWIKIFYIIRVLPMHTHSATHAYNMRTFLELSAFNVDKFIIMAVLNPPLIVVLYLKYYKIVEKKKTQSELIVLVPHAHFGLSRVTQYMYVYVHCHIGIIKRLVTHRGSYVGISYVSGLFAIIVAFFIMIIIIFVFLIVNLTSRYSPVDFPFRINHVKLRT